jgi:hypothetical protein
VFALHAAVRDPKRPCVEEKGCDWERATLCAFDQENASSVRVTFLVCMDKKRGVLPLGAAKQCAATSSLDYDAISLCFNSQRGDDLLAAEAKVFNAAFPGSATIPHTFVNAEDVKPTFETIKKALCDSGSTSSACSSPPLCSA